MFSWRRITRVYSKELTDILRDRRTLAAMVIVPIVLYPLLMLGSVQAISATADAGPQLVVIGVNPSDEEILKNLVERDRKLREMEAEQAETEEETTKEDERADRPELPPLDGLVDDDRTAPSPALDLKVRYVSEDEMVQHVRDRFVHIGVIFHQIPQPDTLRAIKVEIVYDPEETKSSLAAQWLRGVLRRTAAREVERRLTEIYSVPIDVLEPVKLEETRVSTPGSVLSHILPLILVLMTITGAIYPAIDLTAGERERGTLETLMVCPVPVIELIVGKFLVVATVAIAGAALNLASVSATVYFGGFERVLSGGAESGGFPLGAMPVILLSLVPFAILFSAIMIAVSSYARTFKEAQNYITPVILASLIPGGIGALPTSELSGVLQVLPVANMVVLTRELLLGTPVAWTTMLLVLASTTLYAVAAVAVAARVYGAESVVFADSGSLRTVFRRNTIQPQPVPSAAMVVLVAALLFPIWFFIQAGGQAEGPEAVVAKLRTSGIMIPVFFGALPALVLIYWKIELVWSLRLSLPTPRHLLAGCLLGAAMWVPAAELSVLQNKIMPLPEALAEQNERLRQALTSMPTWQVIAILGVAPGVCEELFFRGFMLSGLGATLRKWSAILITACVFGIFHFMFFKLPVTAALGVMLGYLCWQSRSIWPGVVAHATHNSLLALLLIRPDVASRVGVDLTGRADHLPPVVLGLGVALVIGGIVAAAKPAKLHPWQPADR